MIFDTFRWFTVFFTILTTLPDIWHFWVSYSVLFNHDHTTWYMTLLGELQHSFQPSHHNMIFDTFTWVTAVYSVLTTPHDIWHLWISHSVLFNLDNTTWYLTLFVSYSVLFNLDHTFWYLTLLGKLEHSFWSWPHYIIIDTFGWVTVFEHCVQPWPHCIQYNSGCGLW